MNADFDELPEWLREPFKPFREVVSLLLDDGNDELAINTIAAINAPIEWQAEQLEAFNAAKAAMISGVESLAAYSPLKRPEVMTKIQQARERRG